MGIFTPKPVDKRKTLEKLGIDKLVLPNDDYQINKGVVLAFTNGAITFGQYRRYFNIVEPSHPIREFTIDLLVTLFDGCKEYANSVKDRIYKSK